MSIVPPTTLSNPKYERLVNSATTRRSIGTSLLIMVLLTEIGFTMALIPRTSNRFAKQEPITFPRDSNGCE